MSSKQETVALKTAFALWDEDGNGTITGEELGSVLCKLGNFSEKDVQNILVQADKNGDGVLDYQEFVEWLTMPSAPKKAMALFSEVFVSVRADSAVLDTPKAGSIRSSRVRRSAGQPQYPNDLKPDVLDGLDCWLFGKSGRKPIPFPESVELGLEYTVAMWIRFEEPSGDWIPILHDEIFGLQIGVTPKGCLGISDPRLNGNDGEAGKHCGWSKSSDKPVGPANKWTLLVIAGSCSTDSPGPQGLTKFYTGYDTDGIRHVGTASACGSGLVLKDAGCTGIEAIGSIAVWPRLLQDQEMRELFLWDAVKMGVVTEAELKWMHLSRRKVPARTEEEEAFVRDRIAVTANGKAPGGTLNLAGLKISDSDVPAILESAIAAFDSISCVVLSNNYITEDSIKEHLVPFLNKLFLPMRVVLTGNPDIVPEAGEMMLDVCQKLPDTVPWCVDVTNTRVPAHIAERLLNDTPEAQKLARSFAAERKRVVEMCTEYEEKQAELAATWKDQTETGVASDDESDPEPDEDPAATAARQKAQGYPKPYKKFPEGKSEELKTVRWYLASSARRMYDRSRSGVFPWNDSDALQKKEKKQHRAPPGCGTGQFMAHFSYLGYQLEVCKPEDVGLRLRQKGEATAGTPDGHIGVHEAVEKGFVAMSSAAGKGYGRDCVTVTLKNLTSKPLKVYIRSGSIFGHVGWVHHQNLLVRRDRVFNLQAGEPQTQKIGAHCMNVTCDCADKDPMSLTSLFFEDKEIMKSQAKVWDFFEERFEELRLKAGFKKKKGKKGKKK
eukprot:TRINITY_DN100710_c0_g1_i1.p1 TRINITY_DN100710_c0_g1~~TRINITY_DN100710_c0_g1_i1.p1  ORF type:complete len:778 (-),score=210.83 TRINITY_DN100710_c0_g1_i1:440-2773(-)